MIRVRRALRVFDLAAQLLPGVLLTVAGLSMITLNLVGVLWH